MIPIGKLKRKNMKNNDNLLFGFAAILKAAEFIMIKEKANDNTSWGHELWVTGCLNSGGGLLDTQESSQLVKY